MRLPHSRNVELEGERRVRKCQLDLSEHQTVPEVQQEHRKEPGLQSHDMLAVPLRVLLDLHGRLEGARLSYRWLLQMQFVRGEEEGFGLPKGRAKARGCEDRATALHVVLRTIR